MFGRSGGAELIAAKVKLEFLEKENFDLKLQVQRLQEALIAKTSPIAYSNLLAEKAEKAESSAPNLKSPFQEDIDLLGKYLNQLADQPTFSSPDEFIKYVKGKEELESNLEEIVTSAPISEGLHNEES